MHRRGPRIGPPPRRHAELDALHARLGIEIGRPLPGGDGDVDPVALGRDAHHLRAAPGDRADIAVDDVVGGQHVAVGLVELGLAERDDHVHDLGRIEEPAGVLLELEHLAFIGALALEHGAGVVQPMGQDMHVGVLPGNQLAVVPDDAFELVVRLRRHDELPRMWS
jgi:hypothetical protein